MDFNFIACFSTFCLFASVAVIMKHVLFEDNGEL